MAAPSLPSSHWNLLYDPAARHADLGYGYYQARTDTDRKLGTDGWEVLYQMDGRMLRVHPPGSWPVESWKQELLGYQSTPPAKRATE